MSMSLLTLPLYFPNSVLLGRGGGQFGRLPKGPPLIDEYLFVCAVNRRGNLGAWVVEYNSVVYLVVTRCPSLPRLVRQEWRA